MSPLEFWLIPGLAVLAVLCAAAAVHAMGGGPRTARDRLFELTARGREREAVDGLTRESMQPGPVAQTIARLAAPREEQELSALRKRLVQAGYRSPRNVETYSTLRFGLAVLLPLAYALMPVRTGTVTTLLVVLATSAAGYYLPAIWVQNSLLKRREALLRSFPDTLDLMVASVEAGLGLDAAFRRVAEEMLGAAPILSEELLQVTREMNAGVPRPQALHRLEERTGIEEISALVNVLNQADRFGTPIARSLRVHSELVRTRRMQRAEEKAARISPKLTVVMILFILPCLVLLLVGPAMIKVFHVLLPTFQATGR